MSSLIIGTPRPNRITNMPASKFNLSVVTHGVSSQERVRRKRVRDGENVF